MAESQVENQEQPVEVRYSLPKDVHKKIRSHQRKLSAAQDTDATMEQALIDFIRKANVK